MDRPRKAESRRQKAEVRRRSNTDDKDWGTLTL
jgi:hypothetical protein